jgi:hypothetical protein
MNRILACLLLGLCVMSCPSCSSISAPHPISAAVDPIDQQVTLDKLAVTIPLGWVKVAAREGIVKYANMSKKTLLVLSKEECGMTYTQCMVFAIKGIISVGAELNSVDDIEINGVKALQIEASKDGIKLWTWMIIKDGNMQSILCGSPEDNPSTKESCFKIASSLKLSQ